MLTTDVLPLIDEAVDREGAGPIAHQSGDMRLFDAEDLSRFDLRHAAILDEQVDLERELCLQELSLWMGKTEIRENVPAALFHFDTFFRSRRHANSALLCA